MTNHNRIVADQNVFNQQSHNFLTFNDAKRFCSAAQAGKKSREGFCQAQECGTIIGLIAFVNFTWPTLILSFGPLYKPEF